MNGVQVHYVGLDGVEVHLILVLLATFLPGTRSTFLAHCRSTTDWAGP